MSQFWSPLVHSLKPYVPGEQPKISDIVKLNTNENPYPPSPKALEAMRTELGMDASTLRLYPDPEASLFKEAVVTLFSDYSITAQQVFAGNGSDEVLALVFQALLKHEKPLLMPDITYSFYPVYCGLFEINYETIPLGKDFEIRVDDYHQANGGIILANPNAPTGLALSLTDIEHLAANHPKSVIVIDEAYVDFGAQTSISLIHRYDNLLVVRTLSKSHALAGLRIGYAVGSNALILGLGRVKNSFNSYPLDRLAIVGGTAAIKDVGYLAKTRQAIIKSREMLVGELENLGFFVLPSSANFIFASHPLYDAAMLAKALRAQKIIVRHFNLPRIDRYLRISIGTDSECQLLVKALREVMVE